MGINSTVSQGTGKSPLELLCSLRPRLAGDLQGPLYMDTDLALVRNEANKRIEESASRMVTRFNKGRRKVNLIAKGSLVMVERRFLRPGLTSGKLVPRYTGPYKVTAVLPNDRYEVTSVAKGKRAYKNIVAIDKIKRWCTRDLSSSESDCEQMKDQ